MVKESKPAQVWSLEIAGEQHRVSASGSISRTVRWEIGPDLIAEKKSAEEKIELKGGDRGQVTVRFASLGKPRRATYFRADEVAKASTGLGGLDLEPEPGSPAAAYEDKVRAHPQRYALIQAGGGVAKVVLPLLIGLLAVRFAVNIPWPNINWPNIPWPNLPSVPLPDINVPSIPWPDINLPDVSLPGWLLWVLDNLKYIWPIVLAVVLARGEIRRRAKQDELRAERRRAASSPDASAGRPDGSDGSQRTAGPDRSDCDE